MFNHPPDSLNVYSSNSISYNYSHLEAKSQTVIIERTDEIKNLIRRTANNIIEIGHKLHEVKRIIGHGHFGNWLKTEFNWSVATATKMMQASEHFKNVNFTNLNFSPSAIYLLAAPSTPEQARTEALTKAKQGQPITYTLAKQIVGHHKTRPHFSSSVSEPKLFNFESPSFLETKVELEFFQQYTMREWLRLKREKKVFSLIDCKINNFKFREEQPLETQLETFSHILSQGIQTHLNRPTDVFTEYQLGHFLLLLSNTSEEGIQKMIQLIDNNINLKQRKFLESHDSWRQLFTVTFKTFSIVPSSQITLNEIVTSLLMSNQESLNA